ncbi:ATP-dependent RNA helicase DDX60 [Nematocida major]|uniref:ATP-dependent RNA helicase DDX60 n=1 Tax=Nematocida major TaxID=1912982 RepID=UPI002008B95B|nr:ATP-dependent RNA helicase DDX60 [Nematocida major]KAH9386388.1 ATP-dependent RNA helicase DDX60 [Nematocida major]
MKEEMSQETMYSEWYAKLPLQMIDVSESFVGIGKIVINGHSLYRYIEDIYKIRSESLPLKLIDSVADMIGYALRVSGFKDSYIVLFREEEETPERRVCTREVAAVLEKTSSLKVMWFHSLEDKEFKRFIKEEHICLGVGYQDHRSQVFLNTILGFSLYAAVLEKGTFRAPRIFMFVISPVMYLYGEKYATREYTPKHVELEEAQRAVESVGQIVKSHLGEERFSAHQAVLSQESPISLYSRESAPVDRGLLEEIGKAIQSAEVCSLSSIIDGRLFSPQQAPEKGSAQGKPAEKLQSRAKKTAFIPTALSSVKFYNEEQERSFRTEQMYIESLKKNAQSLHEGKHLHNPIALVSEKEKKKKEEKTKMGKKQLEIIEQNRKLREAEAKKKDVAFLRSFLAKYESFSATYEKRRHLETFLARMHSSFICRKVLLLRIEFYSELWGLEKRKKRPNEKDLVSLYMDCMSFIEKYNLEASAEELQYVMQALLDQGFGSTVLEMCEKHEISYANKRDSACTRLFGKRAAVSISYDPATTKDPNDYDISFLMRAAGDKLKRSLNASPDDRLLFVPDGWQKELLDIVDDQQSAVICAPTSSGKTFICYYAMETVLRASNENVVIFVAPTKALVNQVAADVYARFGSKPYIKQNSILQGICMSDFQISPFNCQILITVPDVLEKILCMPPSNPTKKGQAYLSRLRYIVIDEVHKISDNRMGTSMEKIIHFSPCPLLLLSATLGNLKEFYGWVNSVVTKKKNQKCYLVVHRERYCEIKNYVFVPKRIKVLETCHKSTREAGEQSIAAIHSLFAYSFRGIKDEGFSDDVNFLPEELLNLYFAIFAVLRKDQRSLIKEYRPKRFFKTNCITKSDVKNYEMYVIKTFREMIKTGALEAEQVTKIYEVLIREAKEGFQKISKDLKEWLQLHTEKQPAPGRLLMPEGGHADALSRTRGAQAEAPIAERVQSMSVQDEQRPEISSDILLYNTQYLLDNILDLVVELEAADKLPCIVFNLERTVCNALAIRLTEELDKFEKCAPPALSRADLRENEKVLKEMRRTRDAAVGTGKDAWISESIAAEEISGRKIDPNLKDPRFCFTDPTIASSGAYLLDEYAKSLRKTGRLDPKLIHALYRGIGVHHSGIPKKYRNMVEILFRMKQLRVVFATDTLALGINMPCRTAVFAGDSLYLDSMSFKQMAGRAGRRGYDTQGNVVFFGIPKQKVRSLITSYLPRIKGAYTHTNLSAVQAARPTVCKEAIDSMVNNPLMSLSWPSVAFGEAADTGIQEFTERILAVQKKHLVEKMLLAPEVLADAEKGVLQKKIEHTSSLCDMGLNTLSYGSESFVFMSLVNEGFLDKICEENADKEEVFRKIVLLVASIFEVIPLTSLSTLPELPSLSPEILARLDAYHQESILISRQFLRKEEAVWHAMLPEDSFINPIAQSLFVLPYLHTKKNSYILKYFIDQNVRQISKENGIGETELWRRLKNVEDVLVQLDSYYKTYRPTSASLLHVCGTLAAFRERFAKMHA